MRENKVPDVVIGIACNTNQSPDVWSKYLSLRVPKKVTWFTATGALTDKSRNEISKWFLGSGCEWLFFLDDDVQPRPDTLERLMAHKADMVAGIYYRRRPPCDPLMYFRTDEGWYAPPIEWEPGAMLKVDAVGMGCCLIHRRVFEKIMAEHVLYARKNGSLGLAYLGDVYEHKKWARPGLRIVDPKGVQVVEQVRLMRYDEVSEKEQVPFFAFEYGRTEDLHFCELAKRVGVEICVDTSIELYHWGYNRVGREQFEQVKSWMAKQAMELAEQQVQAQDTAGEQAPQYEETRTAEVEDAGTQL